MAVYVTVHWFNDDGKNFYKDKIKVSDEHSRRKMESIVKNYRFDNMWINREAAEKIKDYINKHIYHHYFTAVVIDPILLDDIFINPEKEKIR